MSDEKQIDGVVEEAENASRSSAPQSNELEFASVPQTDELESAEYKMSWRTWAALVALSLSWAITSFAIAGPNSHIGYIIADFPGEEAKASWIANAGLFCLVTLPTFTGTFSDSYGKKWFIVIGALLGVVGSVVAGEGKDANTVIVGSALCGIAGTLMIAAIPASMEIVPAKHRGTTMGGMAFVNASAGVIVGTFAFAGCIENGLGWSWGFYIQGIFYAVVSVLVFVLFNPPPTRIRRSMSFFEIFKKTDYIGVLMLAVGAALLTIPLVWGGSLHPWNSAYVIPFLIIGPLIIIAFGIYEWKGRSDGIMHHDFFHGISFVVFLAYGFTDGMLLYGTSLFIPNQVRSMYTTSPLEIAKSFTVFNGTILGAHLFWGYTMSRLKDVKKPLIVASALLTLFCGLAALAKPDNKGLFEGMIAGIAFFTSATQVIPTAAVSLIVPSHLIATSNTVLAIARGLGGALGIAIFTAAYNSSALTAIPAAVIPVLAAAGVPEDAWTQIIGIVVNAPQALPLTGLPKQLTDVLYAAGAQGATKGYQNVWWCFVAASAMCCILSFFLADVGHKMTDHVESQLEGKKVGEKAETAV